MTKNSWLSLFRLGVRQKVMLVLLTVLLTALSLSGWMALKQEKRDTLKEINQRGSDISRFTAKSLAFSVVGYDYHTIQLLLDEITFSDDIGYAKVVNSKGNVMGESGMFSQANIENLVFFDQSIKLEDDLVGTLTLGLSINKTIQRLESQKYALIKREALIILLIAFGEFLALSYIIIRPVSIMSKSLRENNEQEGKVISAVPVISQDEFGHLAKSFNAMSSQLNEANLQLQSRVEVADKQLMQTNRQLLRQSDDLKRISEDFRKMSITDALTGLHNRRYFEELLQTAMKMARSHKNVNSILLIDIDFFKKINDSYGHPCGDKVLKEIAATLQRSLRKTDILCRLGGEEFIALCKRADQSAATIIGEKMRGAAEQYTVAFGETNIKVTISIGITTIDEQNAYYEADCAYQQADLAVYHSKENGRNRVTHYKDIQLNQENDLITQL